MSTFESQENQSRELLEHPGVYVIFKATKAGATTSIVKVGLEMGFQVLTIVPKKKIGRELSSRIPNLLGHPAKMIFVGPNTEMCPRLDPKIDVAFQFKENCSECQSKEILVKCPFQNMLLNEFDLVCISYSKLQALDFSGAQDALALKEKLASYDVVIFDEFSSILSHIQTIKLVTTDDKGKVQKLSEGITPMLPGGGPWSIGLWSFLESFENKTQSGIYENDIAVSLTYHISGEESAFRKGWQFITDLTRKGTNTKQLQMVFLSMFARKVVIECQDGEVRLTPSVEDALAYIKNFVNAVGGGKRLFVVDSYQPSVNFESLFGDSVTKVVWGESGDPLKTSESELVISDSAHWGVRDFLSRPNSLALQKRIKMAVEGVIVKFSPLSLIIVTTNKAMAQAVVKWNLPTSTMITWYRSELMRGVTTEDRRVMILLGGPYLPKNAYVAQSESFKVEDFVAEMDLLTSEEQRRAQLPRLLKLDDMRGEFVNCIGKPKDAEGRQRSVVIAFGIRQEEIKALLKDNSPFKLAKPHVTRTLFGGAMSDEGLTIAELWMDGVEVDLPNDLSMLARIIQLTRQQGKVPSSRIVLGSTQTVKSAAQRYQHVLDRYDVAVVFKTGGIAFEAKCS